MKASQINKIGWKHSKNQMRKFSKKILKKFQNLKDSAKRF